MPKWIEDRAERIMDSTKDQYGEAKGKQVAYALATQQAHATGKSPKKWKGKPFGTPEGKREAKKKYDDPKDMKKSARGRGLGPGGGEGPGAKHGPGAGAGKGPRPGFGRAAELTDKQKDEIDKCRSGTKHATLEGVLAALSPEDREKVRKLLRAASPERIVPKEKDLPESEAEAKQSSVALPVAMVLLDSMVKDAGLSSLSDLLYKR